MYISLGTDFNWSRVGSQLLIEHILLLIIAYANFAYRILMALSLLPSTRCFNDFGPYICTYK